MGAAVVIFHTAVVVDTAIGCAAVDKVTASALRAVDRQSIGGIVVEGEVKLNSKTVIRKAAAAVVVAVASSVGVVETLVFEAGTVAVSQHKIEMIGRVC